MTIKTAISLHSSGNCETRKYLEMHLINRIFKVKIKKKKELSRPIFPCQKNPFGKLDSPLSPYLFTAEIKRTS